MINVLVIPKVERRWINFDLIGVEDFKGKFSDQGISYLHLVADDGDEQDLLQFFDLSFKFISQGL